MSDIRIRELLRARREQLGLTQAQAAEAGGFASGRLSHLEIGQYSSNYTLGTLKQWATGVNVEFGVYFVADGHMTTIQITDFPEDFTDEV